KKLCLLQMKAEFNVHPVVQQISANLLAPAVFVRTALLKVQVASHHLRANLAAEGYDFRVFSLKTFAIVFLK
ncbi:MAG: hypothetical protein PVI90_15220, partial [Desulfobacteraceae bacterium]